jgi:hypothetical protein
VRHSPLLVILMVFLGCTSRPLPRPQSAAERELVALEYRWAAATKQRDDATVATILAPEWYLLGPHGNVITRALMLAVVTTSLDL